MSNEHANASLLNRQRDIILICIIFNIANIKKKINGIHYANKPYFHDVNPYVYENEKKNENENVSIGS